jgi:AhpD family alkylhydroperoxidase
MPGRGFQRRIYPGIRPLLVDLAHIVGRWRVALALARGREISAAFRERLMMVVTAVNRCRHCAHGHAYLASLAGIPKEEIAALLALDLGHAPAAEIPALLHAIHWAESDGAPLQDAAIALRATYGAAAADQIEMALRLIQVGNRVGNSFDYLLGRVSGGRLGWLESERAATRARELIP